MCTTNYGVNPLQQLMIFACSLSLKQREEFPRVDRLYRSDQILLRLNLLKPVIEDEMFFRAVILTLAQSCVSHAS